MRTLDLLNTLTEHTAAATKLRGVTKSVEMTLQSVLGHAEMTDAMKLQAIALMLGNVRDANASFDAATGA